MNIFVTGATGVLGKAVLPQLGAAGHRVYALTRSQKNTTLGQELGAEPVSANLFDAAELEKALEQSRADVLVHLATKIPPTSRMGKLASWQENDHIRRDGTRVLVDAALKAGVQTIIYPSFYYVYPDRGQEWIDALTTPVQHHPTQDSTLDAEAEVQRFTGGGHRGIVLRMGSLYGPQAPSALEQLQMARKGFVALPGPASAYISSIWTDDAARAIVAAISGVPAGIYDVVDDMPLTRSEFATALAHAVGKRSLLHVPGAVVRLLAGVVADAASRSQRVSNHQFRELSGWKPAVPDAYQGWKLMAQVEESSSKVAQHV